MKSRAIVAVAVNRVELRSFDLPEPGPGEILAEALYSCVSPGTELRCLSQKQQGSSFPFAVGYAAVGVVVRRGPGVALEEGRTIFYMGSKHTGGVLRMWGGHMSHAILNADEVTIVPDGVDPIQASASKMASIPYHGVRLARPLPEERIAVIGLGSIGHMAAKLYTLSGAHTVACDMSAKRVAQARAAGVDAVVAETPLKLSFKRAFPEGADVVVDCTGAPAVMAQTIECARELAWGNHLVPGPRIVVQGSYAEGFNVPYDGAFVRELSFVFPRSDQGRDKAVIFDLIRRNVLSLSSIISEVREPEAAQKTYDELRDPATDLMTVVYKWR
jgi:2-desacetyl-2-hydroxyethyl bacteriochlorophyllide A dehydrogenase